VNALAIKDSTIYAGGTFTNFGGQIRNRLGAADTSSGQVSAWNPDASGPSARIYGLAAFGRHAYVSGQFTTMGGEFRNRLASVDVATAKASSWDPNVDALVRALDVTPEAIYAGGDFLNVGGKPRSYFAVFSNRPFFDALAVANGQFSSSVRTGEGQTLRIQTSTDLTQWTELSAENAGNTAIPLTQPAANPHRFYRALLELGP